MTLKHARNVSAETKHKICLEYGIGSDCPGPNWEIDHLVPLELGGSNDLANLWPQPINEARNKDRVEGFLHRNVCNGQITLEEAQRLVKTWWMVDSASWPNLESQTADEH